MRTILVLAGVALAAPAAATPVPPVDGLCDAQQGPRAAGLASCVMADGTRTLAPRGWCRSGRYGSDGSVASVTPDAATLRPLMAGVIADTRRTHAIAPSTGQR